MITSRWGICESLFDCLDCLNQQNKQRVIVCLIVYIPIGINNKQNPTLIQYPLMLRGKEVFSANKPAKDVKSEFEP